MNLSSLHWNQLKPNVTSNPNGVCSASLNSHVKNQRTKKIEEKKSMEFLAQYETEQFHRRLHVPVLKFKFVYQFNDVIL